MLQCVSCFFLRFVFRVCCRVRCVRMPICVLSVSFGVTSLDSRENCSVVDDRTKSHFVFSTG